MKHTHTVVILYGLDKDTIAQNNWPSYPILDARNYASSGGDKIYAELELFCEQKKNVVIFARTKRDSLLYVDICEALDSKYIYVTSDSAGCMVRVAPDALYKPHPSLKGRS